MEAVAEERTMTTGGHRMMVHAEPMIMMGGAASKLLPETVKEGNDEDSSSTPLLSDNDSRCYSARFSDLKGA